MSNNYYDLEVLKRVQEAFIERVRIDVESKIVRNNIMPGKYNTFNVDDLPEEMRKLVEQQEKEIEDKLIIPKELLERQVQQDQLDTFKQALEIERLKQEHNDPVRRELRELRNEVEHLKDGMRKIGVMLDTDLPDQKAFDNFKALRSAYGKYKMVENLTLGKEDDDKKKVLFERKLKGAPIGYDSFGKAIVEGDILLFAATVGQSAEMRVIKVVETLLDHNKNVKFRIRRAERCWHSVKWTLQERKSIITKLDNTYLLEEPPQEIIDLFEGVEEDV